MRKCFDKAVFVIGPTASGKTALAHLIADRLAQQHSMPCELVNMDAFQFYRNVDIGSAKPDVADVRKYSYRGIDILDPLEHMDAAMYAQFVWTACADIRAAGALPVCVGGSGLYLRAVLHGLDELPARNDALRAMFRASADAWGWPALHGWLRALAPVRAAQLHPNDKTRIERALEIVLQLPDGVTADDVFGAPVPLHAQALVGEPYVIQVDCENHILRERIALRVEDMFARGWIDEVRSLEKAFGASFLASQAGKAIGYREIFEALNTWPGASNGQGSDVETRRLKEKITTLTWQYARRQRTWNAKETSHWSCDATVDIAKIQFPASFLSYIKSYKT